MAPWRRGYAADCKSVYPGSNPGGASKSFAFKPLDWLTLTRLETQLVCNWVSFFVLRSRWFTPSGSAHSRW
jgi:hypothetical protein